MINAHVTASSTLGEMPCKQCCVIGAKKKRGYFKSQCHTRVAVKDGENISTAFLDTLGKGGPNS